MYPVFLNIRARLCIVIGGGSVAERKVKGLLGEGAQVRVISPDVTEGLAVLAGEGKIEWRKKVYAAGDLEKAFLVFAATSDRRIQNVICRQAGENNQLVNVADDPECCTFHVPATVRRGDLALAVSTGGKSPALASLIKRKLEQEFGPEYEILLGIMSLVRRKTGTETEALSQPDRKKIYKKILHNDIIEWIRTGQTDKLLVHLQNVLGSEAVPDLNKLDLDCR